jgi:hypothetical protein
MRWDWDYLWHFLPGLAVAMLGSIPGVVWLPFASVPLFVGAGYTREILQHLDDKPMLTLHRHIEALAWPLGALVGSLVSLAWTL